MNGYNQEHFCVILLNTKNGVIKKEIVAIGTICAINVDVRAIYRQAIIDNAAAIIIVHNHPSGDPEPSTEDITLTKRVAEAGTLLGINLLDHLIVGAQGFISLRERGVITEED